MLCLDNKPYLYSATKLEAEDGLGLNAADSVPREMVIWHYRGAPYEAEIISVYGKHFLWLLSLSIIVQLHYIWK